MSWRNIVQSKAVKHVVGLTLASTGGAYLLQDQGHAMLVPPRTMITQADASTANRPVKAPVVFPTSKTTKLAPTLPIRIIRPNPDLEIAFDVRTRNAIYVLEKLDRGGHNLGKDHKRPNFYEERSIEQEAYRSRLHHFKNSGYDRGHLAPAADFPLQTEDTYNLCNVSPQNHAMNMSIWSQIEEYTRRVSDRSAKAGHETYVVTGPVWLPTYQAGPSKFEYSYWGLGDPPSLVAVPTHFFKVIVVVGKNSTKIVEFACFVVPNTEPNKSKGMHDYIVPWTDLEAVTGLQFFPTLATNEWKVWADHITHESVLRFRNQAQGQLLLTDGKTKKVAPPKNAGAVATLQHLCKGGQCQ